MADSEMRSKLRGVNWSTPPGRADRRCVCARRFQMDVDLFEGVSWAERPAARELPVRNELKSECLSGHQIRVFDRQDQVGRSRGGLEEGYGRFVCDQVGVLVVVRREISREPRGQGCSIAGFRGGQRFVIEVWCA